MRCREKPTGDQIRISLNSGANIHSCNDVMVDATDLGFVSKSDWDEAPEDRKYAAVVEYFNEQGLPEYSWSDARDE